MSFLLLRWWLNKPFIYDPRREFYWHITQLLIAGKATLSNRMNKILHAWNYKVNDCMLQCRKAHTQDIKNFAYKVSELVKCYIWSTTLYGAETWTLRAVDQKHLESFEMWCWRRMEKIIWIDHVRNEEELLRVKEQRDILHEISKRKANWIGHILLRNCLLQRVIEGKIKGEIEVTGRR
jgi:hypothetical protein